MEREPYSWRSCLVVILLMPFGVLILGLVFYTAVHFTCRYDFNTWVIDYPNAEVVEEDYSWLMPYSVGETVRVLYTPDRAATVRSWYNSQYRQLEIDGYTRNNSAARVSWRVVDAQDGEGSLIYIFCSCASRMALW
ncbi:MAG: hypothetical protein CUN56_01915 [Phototrophicales bacterium]|nr:MAG: hypothetical protein CUN56_01915 [Phototrophicales bacterium]RMG74924.1 MAG: hypothetical protein D6711_07795 [Chloroflexota bacterium]